jgi:hypothetical protein
VDGRIFIEGSANGKYAKPDGYDLSDKQDLKEFKEFLTENVTNSVDDSILKCRLNEKSDLKTHPLYGIR